MAVCLPRRDVRSQVHPADYDRRGRRHDRGDRGREVPQGVARNSRATARARSEDRSDSQACSPRTATSSSTSRPGVRHCGSWRRGRLDPAQGQGRQARKPVAIWLTHATLDMSSACRKLRRTRGPGWLHPADRPLYDVVPDSRLVWARAPGTAAGADHDLAHGARLSVGELSFESGTRPGTRRGAYVWWDRASRWAATSCRRLDRPDDLPGGTSRTLIASIERELSASR